MEKRKEKHLPRRLI